MTKYCSPTDRSRQFHCIHCGVYAKQRWGELYFGRAISGGKSPITYCRCDHCAKDIYWHASKMILPTAVTAEPPHHDLPDEVKRDYEEARNVFAASPRAAVALLRLAIQKLMIEIGEKGKKINDDIASLVAKGLPIEVQQALDFCRVVGNNAVHPGEINLDDTPDMGHHLFSMINFIVEDRISRPKKISDLYGRLPEGALAAIQKRDA